MANQHIKKHGHASKGNQSPSYESWTAMKRRCLTPGDTSYYRYGGRGISVCDRWMLFENPAHLALTTKPTKGSRSLWQFRIDAAMKDFSTTKKEE